MLYEVITQRGQGRTHTRRGQSGIIPHSQAERGGPPGKKTDRRNRGQADTCDNFAGFRSPGPLFRAAGNH